MLPFRGGDGRVVDEVDAVLDGEHPVVALLLPLGDEQEAPATDAVSRHRLDLEPQRSLVHAMTVALRRWMMALGLVWCGDMNQLSVVASKLKEAALPALELDTLLGRKAALADLLLERDQHRGATRALDLDALVQCCGDLLPQLGAVCCVRSSSWCQYCRIRL